MCSHTSPRYKVRSDRNFALCMWVTVTLAVGVLFWHLPVFRRSECLEIPPPSHSRLERKPMLARSWTLVCNSSSPYPLKVRGRIAVLLSPTRVILSTPEYIRVEGVGMNVSAVPILSHCQFFVVARYHRETHHSPIGSTPPLLHVGCLLCHPEEACAARYSRLLSAMVGSFRPVRRAFCLCCVTRLSFSLAVLFHVFRPNGDEGGAVRYRSLGRPALDWKICRRLVLSFIFLIVVGGGEGVEIPDLCLGCGGWSGAGNTNVGYIM